MLTLAVAVVLAGQSFSCTPIRVWDGDGPIWCTEGPRVRLSGIATREIDGTCRDNQPCPTVSAEASRDYLVRLIGDPVGRSSEGHVLVNAAPLHCLSTGSGGGDRTAAWCVTGNGVDLSCAMVSAGMALRWERYWREHRC